MRTLYHQPLDPACRAVRMMLGEKRLDIQLAHTDQPGGFPTLIEDDDSQIPYVMVIAEYLNEAYPEPDLLGYEPLLRVDVRRIAQYFSGEIDKTITQPILQSKLYGPLRGTIASPHAIANAEVGLKTFMEFIAVLDERNNWLAGPSFSLADILAAAHISTLDYLDSIDWKRHVAVQRWYRRVKSRRAMTDVLADRIDSIEPPKHYSDPDF